MGDVGGSDERKGTRGKAWRDRNGRADRRETACRRQPDSGERSEANAPPGRPSREVGGLGDPALPIIVSAIFHEVRRPEAVCSTLCDLCSLWLIPSSFFVQSSAGSAPPRETVLEKIPAISAHFAAIPFIPFIPVSIFCKAMNSACWPVRLQLYGVHACDD